MQLKNIADIGKNHRRFRLVGRYEETPEVEFITLITILERLVNN